MSIYYSRQVWALRDPAVKGSVRLVLLCLAEHAGEPGRENDGECWPSQSLLAEETALTVRQVRRALESLAALGYIVKVALGVGRSRAGRYRITLPEKLDICDSSTVKPDICVNGKPDIHDTLRLKPDIYDTNGVEPARENQTSTTVKPDICDRKTGHLRTKSDIAPHTREEPSEPSEPSAEIVGVPPTPTAIHTPAESDAVEDYDPAAGSASETWTEFLDAVCWLCYGHTQIDTLTKTQRGALTSEARRMRAAGTTRDHLRHWWHSVWLRDWRWTQNHERPVPSHIRSTVAATRDELSAAHALTAQALHARPQPTAPPPRDSAPLDSIWRSVQMEALASFPPGSDVHRWLAGSRLVAAAPVDGVPLYVVQLAMPDGASWIRDRLSAPMRRALRGLLRKQVCVEVTAPRSNERPEKQTAPPSSRTPLTY